MTFVQCLNVSGTFVECVITYRFSRHSQPQLPHNYQLNPVSQSAPCAILYNLLLPMLQVTPSTAGAPPTSRGTGKSTQTTTAGCETRTIYHSRTTFPKSMKMKDVTWSHTTSGCPWSCSCRCVLRDSVTSFLVVHVHAPCNALVNSQGITLLK